MTLADLDEKRRLVLLEVVERYYDAVPRSSARAEDFAALTLFVRDGAGLPFYARPTLGWNGAVRAADVTRVRDRQRELGIPEAFEWVAETTPALREAVEASGLTVHEHPLMVLDDGAEVRPLDDRPAGVSVRILGPDDPALPSALALPYLAFGEPGTGIGSAGPAELAAAVRERAEDGAVRSRRDRMRAGLTVVGAAVRDGMALCSGQHQPVGAVSEIVGVGTLPSERRRGLARAVTAALVADARSRGVQTVFLSAGDDDVARMYSRVGFRRIATALIAEPAG
ncbi:MAG TPA: GNAT family N-acetyltransferase [Micromonosporaceae bacterium]|nr:GNAT family N-acetyltransferase [Micromonosporaceae bacterium]